MIQYQVRITIPKDGSGTMDFQSDVLVREDANDDERKIAEAFEAGFHATMDEIFKQVQAIDPSISVVRTHIGAVITDGRKAEDKPIGENLDGQSPAA